MLKRNILEIDLYMTKQNDTNKMAVMPVPKLLISMGAPMMLSMLTQAFYNVVDTFFVSHIPDTADVVNMGDKAINALTLAFPIQMLIICLGVGTGVGTGAALAMHFGRGDRENANKTAGNATFITLCYYAAILCFGIFGTNAFIHSQTKDPVIAGLGVSYLSIIACFSLGSLGFMSLEKKVLAMGRAKLGMTGQMLGALTNIVLDPVMIYGLGPFPRLGVVGAAVATVTGQFVSLILTSVFYFRDTRFIDHGLRYLRPSAPIVKRIYQVGLPAVIMQALTSVMSYGMNLILVALSESAVTAFGLYFKLQSFIFMPAFGMSNGLVPTMSYNYGARNRQRIADSIKYGLLYVGAIMLAGLLLIQLCAPSIVGIFTLSEESKRLSVLALRTASMGFLFAAVGIVLSGVCQALGNGTYSLIVSCIRLLVVILPLAYFLSKLDGGVNLVWIAFPVADFVSMIAAILLSRHLYHQKVGHWDESPVTVS